MNTECDICYNTTIINPCGANNNCKAMVCHNCYYENFKDMDEVGGYGSKCYFCRNVDYRRAIHSEMKYSYFDYNGEEDWDNKYILCMLQVKSYGYEYMSEEHDEYKDFQFCIPCDED
jgi:hypothetical protein